MAYNYKPAPKHANPSIRGKNLEGDDVSGGNKTGGASSKEVIALPGGEATSLLRSELKN